MGKRRRHWFWLGVTLLVCAPAVWGIAAPAIADDSLSPREIDAWGRFAAGSWKHVRVVAETLDENGTVVATTTTDSRTTLASVDFLHVTLKISATVEVNGKRFDADPQIVNHGYFGEGPDQVVRIKNLGMADVAVEGKAYPCQIREASIIVGPQKTVSKLYQSESQAPYMLRRETIFTDAANPAANHDLTCEVLAIDMPHKVLSEMKSVSFERSVEKSPQGSTITMDTISLDVPGGIVSRTSKELDAKGRILRRSTLELVDFNAVEEDPADGRHRLFHRHRTRQ